MKSTIEKLLNWEPFATPLTDEFGGVGLQSIRRNDTNDLIGVVGEKRTIVSNRDCVQSIVDLANSLNIPFGEPYVNLFNRGGNIHVSFPLPEEKIKGDSFDPQIRFTFSHDSSERRRVYFVLSRKACTNVFASAVKRGEGIFAKFSLNHKENFAARIANFPSRLKELRFETEKAIETLQSIRVKNPDLFIKSLVKGDGKRSEKIRAEIADLFANGRGNRGETAWDVFNGYTEYLNHRATYKNTENKTAEENRLARLVTTDVVDVARTFAKIR
jgi:hypothetical protein